MAAQETAGQRIPADDLLEIRYEDLISDIAGTVETAYNVLKLGEFAEVRPLIDEYVAAHADYRANHYEPSEELQAEIYNRWRPHFERYGYEPSLTRTTPT